MVRSVTESLPPAVAHLVIVPYPPYQTTLLRERLAQTNPPRHVPVLDLSGQQPWDADTAVGILEATPFTDTKVMALFLDEHDFDPDGAVEAWFDTHLFPEGEQPLEPFRVVTYLGPGPVAQMLSAQAQFGGAITLKTVELLDAALQPGQAARVRLTWHADARATRAFKVFVHLFSDNGIVAQYDGEPVNGQRPTNTWQAGETIVDPLTIAIPANAAPGSYQLRIGLYDPDTQVRQPVRLADGSAAEYYIGGQIVIK